MEKLISRIFFHNWQQKGVALIAAIVIWLFVDHSMTATKTLPNVAVRVVNLPPNRTIAGMLPDGTLSRKMTLTLSGSRDIIEQIEPLDLQVVIDAHDKGDQWVVYINKKNLVSLDPDIDLLRHITAVSYNEFVVKLSRLITAKIPVTIATPRGEPAKGYQFLDVWPKQLTHTISGPEEQVEELKAKGLDLTLDLSLITEAELENLTSSNHGFHGDEVSFFVSSKWKQVTLPFSQEGDSEINDPDAESLRIDFLRIELLPFEADIPVRVFYPIKSSATINPATYMLKVEDLIERRNGLAVLSMPLFVREVSRQFLEIVRSNIEISIIAYPVSADKTLQWSIQFINPHELENTYTSKLMSANTQNLANEDASDLAKKELYYRQRFRSYMQRFEIYKSPHHPLQLECTLQNHTINVKDVTQEVADATEDSLLILQGLN